MYTIKAFTADGGEYWIHNPKRKNLVVGNPYYEPGDNINGSAEFAIYPEHPYYDKVEKLTTDITFYKDGEEKFNGRVLYDDEDSDGKKKVYVEGELGFLCDSIQRQAVYHDISPEDFLGTVLDIHNSQVEERKQFQLGVVTVTDPNGSIYRYTNYETTRQVIQDKLIDRLGGHLRIRKVDGVRYLDYLADDDFYLSASQTIEFGKNLLDYAKNVDATDLATCIIPLGATQDEQVISGLDAYLTIEDVNGGVDYVTDDAAVAQYGRIFKTVKYDDVTTAAYLLTAAQEYLESVQYENLVLELTAVDLNLTDDTIEELEVGDLVHCVSTPNNVDAWYPISKMKIYLTDFSKNTFTLGTESKNATYTSSNQQTTAEITKTISNLATTSEILAKAMEDATTLINEAVASGYAIHEPNEFIIADDPDYKNAAKYLWRWGYGGLAHYSNGYSGEADGIAITMNGQINGNMLIANSVYASAIDVEYTEALETLIDDAEETLTTKINNLNDQILLAVTDTKEAITQKNYVTSGETETLNLDAWTVAGSTATVSIEEYQNVDCIKIEFTSAGLVTLTQDLGTLPEGTYTAQMQMAYDTENTAPSYARVGFSSSYSTITESTWNGENFYTAKREMEATEADRTAYFGVYGSAGTIVYLKNLRVLQSFEELLDILESSITLAIGEITASVSELYETARHDYCINGSFDDEDDALSDWTIISTYADYVTAETYSDSTCVAIANPSAARAYLRQSFSNPKEGRVIIRFKAACASGDEDTARIRCYLGGTNQYTTAGELSTEWTQFEFEFESVAAGTIWLYLYNYVYSTTVYITDVEILGYSSYYTESKISLLADSLSLTLTSSSGGTASIVLSYDNEEIDSVTAVTSAREAFASESTAITISAGTVTFNSNTFVVNSTYLTISSTGVLEATSGKFSGTITAAAGSTFGPWTIASSAIYRTSSSYGNSSGMYFGTSGLSITDQFKVSSSGTLTANGSLTTTSGSASAKLSSGALRYLYDDTQYGSFSTTVWSGTTIKGIAMHLEKSGYFMSFGRDEDGDGTYTAAYYICYSSSISSYTHNFSGTEKHSGVATFTSGVQGGSSSLSLIGPSYTVRLADDAFYPATSNALMLGSSNGYLWKAVYASSSTISTSDRNLKHDINAISDQYMDFLYALTPVTYMKNGGDRVHVGAISQDVLAALEAVGLTAEDFGGFCRDAKVAYTEYDEDGAPIKSSQYTVTDENGEVEYAYALRYEEFIFLAIEGLQRQHEVIEALTEELATLKTQVNTLLAGAA